jgi:hypothetical protein
MRFVKTFLPWLMLVVVGSSWLEAAPRERGLLRRAAAARAAANAAPGIHGPVEQHQPDQPAATWSMTPELFPQWYGGFHGRMLQNYGYPTGDLGIRGQAW